MVSISVFVECRENVVLLRLIQIFSNIRLGREDGDIFLYIEFRGYYWFVLKNLEEFLE